MVKVEPPYQQDPCRLRKNGRSRGGIRECGNVAGGKGVDLWEIKLSIRFSYLRFPEYSAILTFGLILI